MGDPTEERDIDLDLIIGYTEDDLYERARDLRKDDEYEKSLDKSE